MGFIKRYTNLAGAIHILSTKNITLLDPELWDDRNDRYFMTKYASKKKAKSVAALCFTTSYETYHHWRVFSPGSDGVCIEFEKSKLEQGFESDSAITTKSVEYRKIVDLGCSGVKTQDLPFVKRQAYQDEQEWRIVHTALKDEKPFPNYRIEIPWINRVYLSPWMPPPLVQSVKETLKLIPDCNSLKVYQTTLLENQKWKEIADHASS